ncbi:MAG: hypothetical protein C5S43_00240 [Candidatus Methanocomedens sp.]|nr:MAG: hypothetical protein C5S43_00240 [ANME-2 cluster archaeon]
MQRLIKNTLTKKVDYQFYLDKEDLENHAQVSKLENYQAIKIEPWNE